MSTVYLDHNATAPLAPEVAAAMAPWLAAEPVNASAAHRYGQRARAAIEAARDDVAALVGPGTRPVFTSGGTEADNQALWGLLGWPPRGHLLISAVEHPAVLEPAAALAELGVEVSLLEVDRAGRVDPARLEEALRPETRLVSVMTANNEVGTLQPLPGIVERALAAGVPVHTDAVQAAAWLDLRAATAGADLVSLSGHKIGGPPGIGALVVGPGRDVGPWIRGGGQQLGRRGGTEPTALIVGFAAACRRVARERERQAARVGALAARLLTGLREQVPDLVPTAPDAPRLPNTVHFCCPGADGATLVARLDLEGVAASAGSACASGVSHGSPVLAAMGVPLELRPCSIRLSLGYDSTAADVDAALEIVPRAIAAVREAVGGAHR